MAPLYDLHSLSLWSAVSGLAFKWEELQAKIHYKEVQAYLLKLWGQRPHHPVLWGRAWPRRLTLRTQVCHQAARANKLLGYIRRNARYIRSTFTRLTLYLGLVRAHFAYAIQVWPPQAIELISKLGKFIDVQPHLFSDYLLSQKYLTRKG